MSKPYVHLHLHTEYSLLDGVTKIKPMIERVAKTGMTACAITDHGVMYGAYEFWNACKEFNVKPIIGCEIYVAKRTRFDKVAGIDNERYHLTLLAKNAEGYHNLIRIVSLAHTEGFYYKPRADKELLSKYGKGIIALSGCLGSNFNRYLQSQQREEAIAWIKFLKKNLDSVYIEIQRNGVKDSHDLIPQQLEIAHELKLPVVATCDVHYLDKEDYKIQEIAWCISDGKKITDPDRRQYDSQEFYLKTPEALYELYADMPEVLENTQKIADEVEVFPMEYERIQPKFDPKLSVAETKELLKTHAYLGVKKRYGDMTDKLQQRIDYELKVIDDKGYNDYFLVVEDYVQWAKDNNILVGPGRGSGAGSVVSYSLGITNLDPFQWDLIFERFLNPERPSPPDFDIDFQDDKRDQMFDYMTHKYGKSNTSFIGTFGRLKTKAAIRDVARVMGIDLSVADKLSKMVIVKFGRVHSIQKMRAEVKEFDQIIKSSSELEELAGYVSKLENLARHVSIHACGYLVTPRPITDYVPVQMEAKGGDKIVTQIEGYQLEPLGLMKFDFLGLANLTVIGHTLQQIKYTHKQTIDIDTIPLDDKLTFKLFQDTNTIGVFQFESDGMKKYLHDLKPTEMEDLIFMNAAYRPGPMQYIHDYIERKYGRQKVTYLHPSLEPILKTTYGFAIYQEQVINIAVHFAGYSLGEADILRRAMGKKKPEVMVKEKQKFIDKAKLKGHSKDLAEKVFAYLEPFADYGFNRSHSACYSLIAYQTAYLKAHYPLQFMAGLMETDINSADKLERDLKEAKEMKVALLPPDINKSYVSFSIENGEAIRFGLGGIKGGGRKVMKHIIDERLQGGDFISVDDLVKRVGTGAISKKDLECLIKVGALDIFGSRNQLLAVVHQVFEKVSQSEKNTEGGQGDLFMLSATTAQHDLKTPLPFIDKESDFQRLLWEKEMLGAFISNHPLAQLQHLLATNNILTLSKARKAIGKTSLSVLGIINKVKVIYSKKNNKPMAFVEIEDTEIKVEGVVFPKDYERISQKLQENIPVVITASPNMRDEVFSLVIEDLVDAHAVDPNRELTIDITKEADKERLVKLKEIVKSNPGPYRLKIIYGSPFNHKELVREIDLKPEVISFLEQYRKP